jgi:hypothetical protein
MSNNQDLIDDSFLQFEGIPTQVKGICLKYISEFHVRYLIYSLSSDDEIKAEVEVIHDILTNGGLKFDTGGWVIGFRYVIEYEFFPSVERINEDVKYAKFHWIYPKD